MASTHIQNQEAGPYDWCTTNTLPKYVTEKAYENPKFVEDVIRDVILKLKENEIINGIDVYSLFKDIVS